jgi:SAM-dependent methyltransferase
MSAGIIIYLFVLALFITLGYGAWSAAPWVPSLKADRELLAGAVPLHAGARVYDLGCGDGTLLFAILGKTPGVIGIGYDIALPPLFIGWARIALACGKDRSISLRWGDLFRVSTQDADAVFVYLLPRAQERIRDKLAREVRDDAYVICEGWPLPGIVPERKLTAPGAMPAYVYTGAALRLADTRYASMKEKTP